MTSKNMPKPSTSKCVVTYCMAPLMSSSAIMKYHSLKMEEVNDTMRHLWNKTYQGTGDVAGECWLGFFLTCCFHDPQTLTALRYALTAKAGQRNGRTTTE